MRGSPSNWRRRAARLVGVLTLPVFLTLNPCESAFAQEPSLEAPPPVVVGPAQITVLDLAGYRALALERQPALAAYRASLAAAQAKAQGLDNLRVPTVIRRDLPDRRKQAHQGITAAQAQIDKTVGETLYAVTRNYLSAVYAQEQQAVADQALATDPKVNPDSLRNLRNLADELYRQSKRRDYKEWNIKQIDVLIKVSEARREEARQGLPRALSALREALGVEPNFPLSIPDKSGLPHIDPPVDRVQIRELALARRAEIIQACVAQEVTALEIHAQEVSFAKKVATFGSGSDLHAQAVPLGISNGEYRPSATGIEMPANLVGQRNDRVEQARAYHARAAAVLDKTRQLITLEAEDNFYKWQMARAQLEALQAAQKLAEEVANEVSSKFERNVPRADANKPNRPNLQDLLDTRVRATQLTVEVNEARYRMLLALAALERVTAGGFCAGFETASFARKNGTNGTKP